MEKINYHYLDGSQLNTFVRTLLSFFNVESMSEGVIKTLAGKLITALDLFAKGFEYDAKNPYTTVLNEKDTLRDKYFIGFKNYLKSFLASDEPTEVDAAEKMLDLIDKHGSDAASLGYAKETTALTGLISELDSECSSELELLGAGTRIERLRTAQADFEEAVNAGITEGAVELPTITKYRPALITAVNKLLNALDSDYDATADETVGSYISRINELITTTMATAKAVKTRRDNQTKESGEENADEPANS